MTRIMAGVLGVALLTAPLSGFAQEMSTPAKPPSVKSGPQQKRDQFCQGSGNQLTGTVVGVSANWGGTNYVTFTVQDSSTGNTYTDTPSWPYTYTQAKQMFSLLMTAYLSGSRISMVCVNSNVNGFLLGGFP